MTITIDEKGVKRGEGGRFVKGTKQIARSPGRPTRGDVMPVLIAVSQKAYSSEELVQMIHDTYDMAKDEKDWKGMYTVINFIVQYAVGKPVQRTLTASINPNDILSLLKDGHEGTENESSGGVVDEGAIDVAGAHGE